MQNKKQPTKFIALATLIAVAITIFTVISNQGGSAFTFQGKIGKDKDEKDKIPIAVYTASLPADPQERALRLARNDRYNNRYTVPFDELPLSTMGRIVASDWHVYMLALPANESDAVVLAEVVSANAYVSNDGTGAYSEFTLRIKQVLKDDQRGTLNPDGSIVAEREGAIVQLSSGRTIRYGISGQGTPQISRLYVFFLKYNNQGEDYQILTGYELRKGHVSPLDEVDPFLTYKRVDEKSFLNTVNEAVSQTQEKRRLNQ